MQRVGPGPGIVMHALLLGVTLGSALLHAWAISLLWGWYVAPIFGWPHLSAVRVLGILLLIGIVRTQVLDRGGPLEDLEAPELIGKRIVHLALDVAVVVIGWVGTFWL